jgi:hypothetical protein
MTLPVSGAGDGNVSVTVPSSVRALPVTVPDTVFPLGVSVISSDPPPGPLVCGIRAVQPCAVPVTRTGKTAVVAGGL